MSSIKQMLAEIEGIKKAIADMQKPKEKEAAPEPAKPITQEHAIKLYQRYVETDDGRLLLSELSKFAQWAQAEVVK
jgi:hypothetical protein